MESFIEKLDKIKASDDGYVRYFSTPGALAGAQEKAGLYASSPGTVSFLRELSGRIPSFGALFPLLDFEKFSISLVNPEVIIARNNIKGLCWTEYLRYDASGSECAQAPCGGIIKKRSACPQYAWTAAETDAMIKKSSLFVTFVFSGLSHPYAQVEIHKFLLEAEKILKGSGFEIVESFGSGPCRICEEECLMNGDCRLPGERRFSLESCGIMVESITQAAPYLTLYGSRENWKLEWMRKWQGYSLEKRKYKSVVGVLLNSGKN